MLALLFRPFPKNVTYWIHSGQFTYRLKGFRRILFKYFFQRVNEAILVSGHIYPMLDANGLQLPKRHRVQHAFLPPDGNCEKAPFRSYPGGTRQFIKTRSPLLVMQGSFARHNGVDRYGSDISVEMMHRLVMQYPRAGLIIGQPTEPGPRFRDERDKLNNRISNLLLSDHIHLLVGEQELWPLIRHADLFLRPSNQDGDSISVREALHFGVPVLASDACPRPEGVMLFRNRDLDDFTEKTHTAISQGILETASVLPNIIC